MKTIKYLMILSAFIMIQNLMAQDKIVLKTGEIIDALVIEKSDKDIKYKIIDSDDSPIIILKTNKVEKITFRNGQEMDIVPDLIRMDKRFGINGGLMFGLGAESAYYKLQADYYITPGLNLEFNGLIEVEDGAGMTVGAKYYFDPYNPKKLKGYAGLMVGSIYEDFLIQVPFGINYIGKSGFDLKFGLSGLYVPSYSGYGIYSELLLGWRF